jgi:SAM-dependent methyltransferase
LSTTVSVDVPELEPSKCFGAFIDQLSKDLEKNKMKFDTGTAGKITEDGVELGRVLSWQPGKEIALEWRNDDVTSKIIFTFGQQGDGTRITLSWDRPMDGDSSLGWFAEQVASPFLLSASAKNFGDWLTDRKARKPWGPEARKMYSDPMYHKPNFYAILNALALTKDDYLLEVGCGGGVLLNWALKSGCKAAAIDHSPDMVALAKETNADALNEGRLEIRESDAYSLPFSDSIFTCAVSTGVFGFISNPVVAMREVHRTLKDGGRFVMFTATKALKGTVAAPEPMATRLFWHEDEELVELARKAGFRSARVENPELSGYARQAGLPEDVIKEYFTGSKNNQLLIAVK